MAENNEKETFELKQKSTMRKKEYKNLLDQGAIISTDENADSIQKLEQIVKIIDTSNMLNAEANTKEKTNHSTEVLMDAQVFKMSYELMGSTMQKIGNEGFSDELFALAIRKFISDAGSLNWGKLEGDTARIIRTPKFSQSLLGAFECEPNIDASQQVRERQKRKAKAALGDLETPETVDKLKPKEKYAEIINLIMSQLVQLLNIREKIPYFELITDPQSFPNTVDNAFQLAFLVRDGQIKLALGHNKEPYVAIVPKETRNQVKDSANNCQTNVCLNKRTWKACIEKFNIKKPLLVIDRNNLTT